MEAQNDPIIHLFCYFGDLLTRSKLVQTDMPATANLLGEIRVISDLSMKFRTQPVFSMYIQHNSCTIAKDQRCEHERLYKQLIFESMGCNTFEINDYLRTPKTAHYPAALHTNIGCAPLPVGFLLMDSLDLRPGG